MSKLIGWLSTRFIMAEVAAFSKLETAPKTAMMTFMGE
jgi:hypothetical protein